MEKGDYIPEDYLIAEVAGQPPKEVPMTPGQEVFLKLVIDPWLEELEMEMKADKARMLEQRQQDMENYRKTLYFKDE